MDIEWLEATITRNAAWVEKKRKDSKRILRWLVETGRVKLENKGDTVDKSKSYAPFNINGMVRVKLTDHGRAVHRRKHCEFWASVNHPSPVEYVPPPEDEDGWSEWQMWALMDAFGDHVGVLDKNCFDLTIEIELPK